MRNLCAIIVLLTSPGCALTINPDTGRLTPDAGMGDSAMPMGDSGDGDASTTDVPWCGDMPCEGTPYDSGTPLACGGLPLGPQSFPVRESSCDGPLSLATHLTGTVNESGSSCWIASARLRVVCDSMYVEMPMDMDLSRVGTTYTSPDSVIGCEGVSYTCHASFNSATGERRIDCTSAGLPACTIDLI